MSQNVQPVEVKTQDTDIKPFDVEELKKKVPKAFQGYLEPVLAWAASVEQRFKDMEEVFPQKVVDELQKRIQKRAETAQPQPTAQPVAPSSTGGLSDYAPVILQQLLGGGGGNDELSKMAMAALQSQINMSNAISNAVVSKVLGKATSEVAHDIVPE